MWRKNPRQGLGSTFLLVEDAPSRRADRAIDIIAGAGRLEEGAGAAVRLALGALLVADGLLGNLCRCGFSPRAKQPKARDGSAGAGAKDKKTSPRDPIPVDQGLETWILNLRGLRHDVPPAVWSRLPNKGVGGLAEREGSAARAAAALAWPQKGIALPEERSGPANKVHRAARPAGTWAWDASLIRTIDGMVIGSAKPG